MEDDPCRFALTSRGADGNMVRFVLQTCSPDTSEAWVAHVTQILDSQRNFLNGENTLPACMPTWLNE